MNTEIEQKFCVSYSCGKDSALALHRMVSAGHKPVALVVTVSEETGRSWFHGVSPGLLGEVSAALNIPLIEARCGGRDYEAAFEEALGKAKALGASSCVFGDIDIKDHRAWNEARCGAAGLDAVMPLWQENRLAIAEEFVQAGFKACINIVSKRYGLGKAFLGRTLTMDAIREISGLGLDPCGENGEYHTFCYDGPTFSEPVRIKQDGVHESEFAYALRLEQEA